MRWLNLLFTAACWSLLCSLPALAQEEPREEAAPAAQAEDANTESADEPKAEEPKGDGEQESEPQESEPQENEPQENDRPRRRRGRSAADLLKNSDRIKALFREVIAETRPATVAVFSEGKQVALGAIVEADGYVITKASELGDDLECKLYDSRIYAAEYIGLHKDSDLALLKIDAEGLAAISWREEESPPIGAWLATPGLEEDPLAVGVVSVSPRKIPPPSGLLGVLLEESDDGVRINQVVSGSAAEQAGLRVNDIIVKLNGRVISDREDLIKRVRRFAAGDVVRLTIRRGEETLEIVATLGSREDGPGSERSQMQNTLGGRLSDRRRDFASVLQHDSVLSPEQCGGPLVDLDGKVIGINIARAGRVDTYALPAALVRPLVSRLKSGELSPHLARLDEIENSLSNLTQIEKVLDKRMKELEEAVKEADTAKTEAKEAADKALAALDEAKQKADEAAEGVEAAREDLEKARQEIEKLNREKNEVEKAHGESREADESEGNDAAPGEGEASQPKSAPDKD